MSDFDSSSRERVKFSHLPWTPFAFNIFISSCESDFVFQIGDSFRFSNPWLTFINPLSRKSNKTVNWPDGTSLKQVLLSGVRFFRAISSYYEFAALCDLSRTQRMRTARAMKISWSYLYSLSDLKLSIMSTWTTIAISQILQAWNPLEGWRNSRENWIWAIPKVHGGLDVAVFLFVTLKHNYGTCHAGWAIKHLVISDIQVPSLVHYPINLLKILTLPSSKSTSSQPFKEKRISEVVRIDSIIIFHMRVSYEKPSSSFCVMWDFWWGCSRNLKLIRTLVHPASWIW